MEKVFLSDRYHFVCINNTNSNILSVLSGVPQDTVLGPKLFITYVNDMSRVVTKGIKLRFFADDSKIYKVIVSIIDCICLQMVLSQVSFWSGLWQLTLNCDKSLMLHLDNANPRYVYTIEGRPLSAPDCVRDHGVTTSKNLFFHDHIKQIIANFLRKLFIVRKFIILTNSL